MSRVAVNTAWITRQRDLRGWTQGDLAAIVGVNESTIWKIETRGSCETKTLVKLRAAFDDNEPVPGMADLLAGEGGDAA